MSGVPGTYGDVFRYKTVIWDSLFAFGFVVDGDEYVYSTFIVDGQFRMVVRLDKNGCVSAQLFDTDTDDEYILHLTTDATGAFIGKVRTEFCSILQNIADNCFAAQVFKSEGAAQVIRYIRNTYQDEFEFLWNKFPDNAIVRRKDNKKWYAAILTVKKDKLGLVGNESIEILDLRMKPEDIAQLVDGEKYFPGYHMNKRNWVTLRLDDVMSFEEIFMRIDESYILAKK